MKARSLVSCILLLILVILLLSTVVQATEYREVKAEEILKQIESGEEVNLTNCRIVGELNVSKMKLETVPNPNFDKLLKKGYTKEDLINIGCKEKLSVFKSDITITNSSFESRINFPNVLFNNSANFSGVTFNNSADFSGVTFNNSVDFFGVTFNNSTDFYGATFNNSADFYRATFSNSVDFSEATFNNSADFSKAIFNNSVYFHGVIFNNFADFYGATFNNSAYFYWATFSNSTDFSEATFNNSAHFYRATFNNYTSFYWATFNNSAHFDRATFTDSVDFSEATFTDSADFSGVTFNNSADFWVPETSENILTDGESCEFLRECYKAEARYTDADNIYYNYRKNAQDSKAFQSLSELSDILSWITCGYGVRLSHTIYCIMGILLFFSFLYWALSSIQLSEVEEKKLMSSRLEPILISIYVFTALGSTDLYSKSNLLKTLITVERFMGWIMLGIFMATLTNLMIRT